ncbi:hypothetical protein ACFIQF_22355 [Comamonas sp. J-3]|uniref:hypothetical protein n=1 Tax=Comamonas trifloxystrobinivorans TaxID=3350256 RepID=UPI00372B8D66
MLRQKKASPNQALRATGADIRPPHATRAANRTAILRHAAQGLEQLASPTGQSFILKNPKITAKLTQINMIIISFPYNQNYIQNK